MHTTFLRQPAVTSTQKPPQLDAVPLYLVMNFSSMNFSMWFPLEPT